MLVLVLHRPRLVRAGKYLRGHVVQCARPRDGQLRIQVDGQAEVCELHHTLGRQQDVLGLNIAMDDALGATTSRGGRGQSRAGR